MAQQRISDTVTVTDDGRLVVDVRKLFAKKHIQETMRLMREKVVVQPRAESATNKG